MLDKFLNFLKNEKRYSKHTIAAYERDLNQLTQFLAEEFDCAIRDATATMLRSWIVFHIELGSSPTTIRRKVSAASRYYRWLQKLGRVKSNPTKNLSLPKKASRLPEFFTAKDISLDEFDAVYESVEADDFTKTRDRLLIELLYQTGMRRAELMALKPMDFDMSKMQVRVLGKGNKERLVPIANSAAGHLHAYLEERKNLERVEDVELFLTSKGRKLYPTLVYKVVNLYFGRVSALNKKSPHVLRHTFATHMLNNGADLNAIKELLGHASLAATQVYTHNSFEQLKSIHKQAHPRA